MSKLPFRDYHCIKFFELFEKERLPVDLLLNRYFRANKALGSQDKKEISETVYGIIRNLSLIDAHLQKPISWPLRIEAFKSGLFKKNIESFPPHIQVSFPKPLFDKIVESHGFETAMKVCAISNEQAPATIRTNLLKIERDALFSRLQERFSVSKTPRSPWGITFDQRINFFQIPEFKEGFFEAQDEASQLVAALVDARPGDHVLDYCSGSGGKTLAFAPMLQGRGQIFLHDTRPHALMEAKKRLARAGIQNAQTAKPGDKKLALLKGKADVILVDSPCSGSGTLRRNPDMKWRFDQAEFEKLLLLQRDIFNEALTYLRPGGKIIFATCSLLNEENEGNVKYFIDSHPLELIGTPFRTLPESGGMDGFFGAVFALKKHMPLL